MIAAAFAAATSDTLSSELGNVYGRRFYNIIGFKKGERGLNGVISLEGSLWGIAGALLIAIVYAAGLAITAVSLRRGIYVYGMFLKPVLVIVVAGTIGNLFDSILGATWERRRYIGNNMVNFLNTVVAVFYAWLLEVFFL